MKFRINEKICKKCGMCYGRELEEVLNFCPYGAIEKVNKKNDNRIKNKERDNED